MFNIGEFARLGGVSIRMLRHYDEIGLFAPSHVDTRSGYRRYSAAQLATLNRVVALKELGFSLEQVRAALESVTVDELRGMLRLRHAQLESDIETHIAQLTEVEARLRYIEEENAMPEFEILLKPLPAQTVAVVSRSAPGMGPKNLNRLLADALAELRTALASADVAGTGSCEFFTFYTGDTSEGTLEAHVAVPVSPGVRVPSLVRIVELDPVEQAATLIYRGPVTQETYPRAYRDLARWISARGLVADGHGRDVALEVHEDGTAVMEIQWPVTPLDTAPG